MNEIITTITEIFNFAPLVWVATPTLLAGLVAAEYYDSHVVSKYKLKRDSKEIDIKEIKLPPDLRENSTKIDIEKIENMYLGHRVIEFIEKVTKVLPKEELTSLYNNINTVKIETMKQKLKRKLYNKKNAGEYISNKNQVLIKDERVIYHELFHLASANTDEYVGFRQPTGIGRAINEGYTDLITERYFKDKMGYIGYPTEMAIVKEIENIVGEEKMRKLYFKTDLLGLIEELKKYVPEEDVLSFINGLDILNRYNDTKNSFKGKKSEYAIKAVVDIMKLLVKIYYDKEHKKLDEGEISTEKFYKNVNAYYYKILFSLRVDHKDWEFEEFMDPVVEYVKNSYNDSKKQGR